MSLNLPDFNRLGVVFSAPVSPVASTKSLRTSAVKIANTAESIIKAKGAESSASSPVPSNVQGGVAHSAFEGKGSAVSNPALSETTKKTWIVQTLLAKVKGLTTTKKPVGVKKAISSDGHEKEIKQLQGPKISQLQEMINKQQALLQQLTPGKKLSYINGEVKVTERVRYGESFSDTKAGQSQRAIKAVEYQLGALEWLVRSQGTAAEKYAVGKLVTEFCQNDWVKLVIQNNPSSKQMSEELKQILAKEMPLNKIESFSELKSFITAFPSRSQIFQFTGEIRGEVITEGGAQVSKQEAIRSLIEQAQCQDMIRMRIDPSFYKQKLASAHESEVKPLQEIFSQGSSEKCTALSADANRSLEMVLRQFEVVTDEVLTENPLNEEKLNKLVSLLSSWIEANKEMPQFTQGLQNIVDGLQQKLAAISQSYGDKIQSALQVNPKKINTVAGNSIDLKVALHQVRVGDLSSDDTKELAKTVAQDVYQYMLASFASTPPALYSLSPKDLIKNPHEKQISELYDGLSAFFGSQIVNGKTLEEARRMIEFTVEVTQQAVKQQNFLMAHSLYSALTSIPVFRLFHAPDGAFEGISDTTKKDLEQLQLLFSQAKNFLNLRRAHDEAASKGPIIPFFGMFHTDITFICDANKNETIRNYHHMKVANKVGSFLSALKPQADQLRPLQTNFLEQQRLEGNALTEYDQIEISYSLKPPAYE